jgi:AbrB family looped-hinge helix DNA binding protein
MIATMTSKGQITIPRAIRDQLGLNAGTQVEFEVSNGRLVGHKVVTLREADLWMAHSDVLAAVGASLEQSVAGRTAGPVELDDFVERHAR